MFLKMTRMEHTLRSLQNNYGNRDYICHLIESQLRQHPELIIDTAIKHCHTSDLHSFIVSLDPKVRLFVALPGCDLFSQCNIKDPIIPIHPHKHMDVFCNISGTIVHHMYEIGTDINFFRCKYFRLSDDVHHTKITGWENLNYLGPTTKQILLPRELHTVSLVPDKNGMCAWTVTEFGNDEQFESIGYCKSLGTTKGLYRTFDDPISFIQKIMKV